MKICDVAVRCPTERKPGFFGGAEISRRLFHKVLLEGGHEVVAIRGGETDEPPEMDAGRRVVTLKFSTPTPPERVGELSPAQRILWHARDDQNPDVAIRIGRLLDDEQPDVVFTGNLGGFSSAVWLAASERGLPIVHYLHDFYLTCHRSIRYRNRKQCERSCVTCVCLTARRRSATDLVHSVVGNSQYTLDLHTGLGMFANARGFVQPPYVHEPVETTAPSAPHERVRLGYLGRISPEKGIGQLIAARQQMKVETDLVVAGLKTSSKDMPELDDDPSVAFLGLVRPSELFQQIDLLVVPSLWNEPFGRVVVEGWSHGVPVAASARGGLAHLPPPEWQFDPDDVASLARTLDVLCGSREIREGEVKRARQELASYSAQAMLDQFEAAFGEARMRAGAQPAA